MLNIVQVPTDADNFDIGRNSCAVAAIYLHPILKSAQETVLESCRATGKSYHYVADCNAVYKLVDEADTALTFSAPANPPVLPAVAGCSDNQRTVNIAVPIETIASVIASCGGCSVAPCVQDNVNRLIHKIAAQLNLTVSAATLLIAPGFPDCFRVSYTPPAENPPSGPLCFPPHEDVQGCQPLAVWDGNCLKELVGPVTVNIADYTANLSVTAPINVVSAAVNSVIYVAPTPIPVAYPNAASVVSWLNGLGIGTWIANFVSGTAPNFTVQFVLLGSENSFTLNLSVGPALASIATNVRPVTIIRPITSCDIATGSATDTDDQLVASANGSIIVTPTVVSGGQINYNIAINPALLAADTDDQIVTSTSPTIVVTPTVVVGGQINYALSINPAGFSTAVCTAFAALPAAVVATPGLTELVGRDCNVYTLPVPNIFFVRCDGVTTVPVGSAVMVPGDKSRNRVLTVVSGSLVDIANADVFVFRGAAAGTVTLVGPTDPCLPNDLWIKNRSRFTLDIVGPIDGGAGIQLDGAIAASYPFNNNGGEAVHLQWDAANNEWLVL